MRDTFSILFYLKNEDSAEKSIYCRISICGVKAPFYTKLKIKPQYWDQETKRGKGRSKEIPRINLALSKLETELTEAYEKIRERRKKVDPFYLRDYLQGNVQDKENVSILTYFDQFNSELDERVKAEDLTDETRIRYVNTRERLSKFIKEKYQRDDLYLDEIDVRFARRFRLFICTNYKCKNNTAQKYVQKLKTVITDAWGNSFLVSDKLIRHKLKYDHTNRTYLTWAELKRIMQKKFYSERLEKVRDMFVFACFTGMAYGDIRSLTEENFNLMNDNNEWIDKDRNKTKVKAEILFSDIPKLIIEKYKDRRINNRLIPIISNQKCNDYLKEIAALCKVNKNLTCHVARHTFATTVTLTEGVPLESISKMLGHTNTVTTQIYAKIVNEKLRKDASEWNKKMVGIEDEFNLKNQ